MKERFNVLLESDIDSQAGHSYSFPDITKSVNAEFYVSGSIIWTGNMYVSSIEFGNTAGKKIRINKAGDSLDMVLTSIMNVIEQQEDLF